MQYTRLVESLNKYKLIPANSNHWDYIKSNEIDYYLSLYSYNDEHYKQWKQTGSVSGIKDVATNKILFDFDDAANPDNARQDALELISRLTSKGIKENAIRVSFSGSKGFCVEIETTNQFTPEHFKLVTSSLAEDLITFDKVVSDPNRIIRVIGTKHPKSGLYKTPISVSQLAELPIDQIRDMAKNLDNIDEDLMNSWTVVDMPESLLNVKPKENKTAVVLESNDLDLTKKPKWLTDAKFALQEGYFGSGERNTAFMILASTYKNQGFSKEIIYRMLKGVAEVQATRNNVDRFSDEELYNKIVNVVCNPTWKGGQYAYENTPLLQDVTKRLGLKVPSKDEGVTSPMTMVELGGEAFVRYAKSFYETRIYTGLKEIDEAFPICAGSNVAIVGAASSGKTALSLNILRESNKQGVVSVFASLDMSKSRLYEKMLYSVTEGKVSRDELYKAYINGNGHKYDKLVAETFPNTYIYSKSAPSVDELRTYINSIQEKTGKPVRLLLIDYFERLGSEKSDDTAASKDVAGGIQDLISDFPELTPITLYQPNKAALGGGPDKPISSYTSIKGSSFVYQSARQILALWRPMFTPDLIKNDKFMEMAILKNDLGELGKFTFKWEGKTGNISSMTDSDYILYHQAMQEKAKLELNKNNNGDF